MNKGTKDGEENKIIAAVIEIYHLLPNAAFKFLEPLVTITINLESQLHRESSSPYRAPLVKYLNKYKVKHLTSYHTHSIHLHPERSHGILLGEVGTATLQSSVQERSV